MVEQGQGRRRVKVWPGVRATGEDHRATPFELFFDLVYVFAVTQVTGYMAGEHKEAAGDTGAPDAAAGGCTARRT